MVDAQAYWSAHKVAPTPCWGPAPLLLLRVLTQDVLVEDPGVGAPVLVHINGTQFRPGDVERRAGLRETGDVGDDELRPRLVGREALVRVGQNERLGEVGVRAVDQRNVPAGERG